MFAVLHVLPLALGAAVSPALIGASLEILGLFGPRGRKMLTTYLLGAALVVGAAVGLALLLPTRANSGASRSDVGTVIADSVDLVLGGLLLVLALVLLLRRPKAHGTADGGSDSVRRLQSARSAPLATFGLGIVMMLTNISTLALALAGAHGLRSSHEPVGWVAAGGVLLIIGALLPILLPLVWELIAPTAATRDLARLNAVLVRDGRVIGVVVSGATAIYLIARGLGFV